MNTHDLLTALKAHYDGASDYRIAQILDVTPQSVYRWKHGQSFMSDDSAIKAAELLELDPVTVLLDLHMEREHSDAASQVWKLMRERLHAALGPVVVGFAAYGGGVLIDLPLV